MATSGSYNWTETRNQIINRAFRIATTAQENPSPDEMVDIAEALNSVVKTLQNNHVHLWAREWVSKTFTASSEVTGTDGLIYTCIKSHTSSSSNKPITGADYTTYWAQTGSTGGTWVTGTAYVSIGDFLVDADTIGIEAAFIRDGGNDYQVEIIGLGEYFKITDKDKTGRPFKLVFHRKLLPQILLYYQPDSTDYVLHYLRVRKLEDFDDGSNNPDFPESWINTLTWLLAAEIGPEFGTNLQRQSLIDSRATALMAISKKSDSEVSDTNFIQSAF